MSCGSAMGHLLPKLGEFLKHEHNLQTSMKEDIESLETQLRRMHDTALLSEMMPRMQQQQYNNKHRAYDQLRELSYGIEDIVDSLLLSIDDAWEPMANQDTCFRETLEGIKAQVKNLAAWQAEFVAKPTMTSTVVDPSPEDGFVQARQLVGIHKLKS
jgi:molecular chaperone GrpE (heat shock protein)